MTETDDTGPDQPVCGWLRGDAVVCTEPREILGSHDPQGRQSRCREHNQPQYQVCVGCGAMPYRTCGPSCHLSLCERCRHHGQGEHGPGEPGPFAAQRQTADPVNQIREQMIDTVIEALTRCAVRGLCSFDEDENAIRRVAGVVVDRQAAKALSTLYEGMAAGTMTKGPGS